MSRRALFISIFLTITINAQAELKRETVSYKEGDTTLEGYLVYDDRYPYKRPGILVIHEWLGLNDYIKSRADQLAELGYIAFAADIYGKGIRPSTTEEAAKESSKYKANRLLLRSRGLAALQILKETNNVDQERLGAVGYCFGGTTVLELARSSDELKTVVSFHGGLSNPAPQRARNIKAKILILHGNEDPYVSPSEVMSFRNEMNQAGIPFEFIGFPGIVHGFTNPSNTGNIPGALYNRNADKSSWDALVKFLALNL